MRSHFVKTANLGALEDGVRMLAERGAREASWMLVTGRPGEGKTTTLYNWGAANAAAFVTLRPGLPPGRLLAMLAAKLGVAQGQQLDIDTALGASLAANGTPVILDEAHYGLAESAACLERLRGITDKSGTPVVLVTMEREVWRFGEREQIASRMFAWVEFKPASVDDVAAVCRQLAEVEIAPDLVARIHADSQGRMRSVLNAISRVEMAAQGLGKAQVSAADCRRMTLVEDYRSGRAITRRPGRTPGSAA